MVINDREIQETYARWLDLATRIGFAVSLCAFLLYASAALPAYVPLSELPRVWGLPVHRFIELTGAPQGWEWLSLLGYGDYLCLAAVALFGLVTLACYVRIVPILMRRGAWLEAALALAQVVVLVAAASGVLAGAR